MAILAREGFSGTSFQKIADTLRISQSAVLYHFSTKESLIEAVILKIIANNHVVVSGSIKSEDNGRQRLKKHFESNLTWAQKNPIEAQVIILLYYFACFQEPFSELYSKVLKGARQRIVDYLHAGQREGLFPKNLQVEMTGQLLHDALLGGIINAITGSERLAKTTEIRKKWERLFERLLH